MFDSIFHFSYENKIYVLNWDKSKRKHIYKDEHISISFDCEKNKVNIIRAFVADATIDVGSVKIDDFVPENVIKVVIGG